MVVVIFAVTYIATAGIHAVIMALAKGDRVAAFKAVSPGMLPPLGIMFALFVAFTASQIWNENEAASAAVAREASALRTTLVLAASFPGEAQKDVRARIRRYIQEVTAEEWPEMAKNDAGLFHGSHHLAGVMVSILAVKPTDPAQQTAQTAIVTALENALDARRQRILISEVQVSLAKWACMIVQALCTLIAIGMVHCERRLTAAVTMGLFATGVAVSFLLIAAYAGPFGGDLAIGPGPLVETLSEMGSS